MMFVLKEDKVDGIGPWLWPETDTLAFGYIKEDWENVHKENYFQFIKDKSICIQAGGNCGMYPRLLAEHFGIVYTFEPDPINFYCLVNNCQKDGIIKMQAALGYSRMPVQVNRIYEPNCGMHTVSENPNSVVPQIRIDDLNIPACGFIQLDIERYEINALKGAEETIRKFKPVIACENANTSIHDFLGQFGYTPKAQSYMDTIYTVE